MSSTALSLSACALTMLFASGFNLKAEFPSQFLSYSVLIQIPTPNGIATGSGFYYQTESNLFLVTARHVIYGRGPNSTNLLSRKADLISYFAPESSDEKLEFQVDLEQARLAGNLKRHQSKDVAIIRIGEITHSENNVYTLKFLPGITRPTSSSGNYKGFTTNEVSLFKDTTAGSDIVMIGFPSSLAGVPAPFQPIDPAKPLLRSGIIAGRNSRESLLIIDAAAFQGNSGGPVVQLVEIPNVFPKRFTYKVEGIVGGFVPHAQVWRDQYESSLAVVNANSGYAYVTPMDAMFELIK